MRGLITGATSGIGREYAYALGKKGYNLILTGRRKEVLEKIKDELENRYKVECHLVIGDFSRVEIVEELIRIAKKKGIDMLINNVGFGNEYKFFQGEYAESEKMIDVHIKVMTRLTHDLVPTMKKGTIINVSSLASFLPTSYNNVYGGTKAYINIFTESLYLHLKKKGFKVQLLLPSFTYTQFHAKIGIKDSQRKNKGLIRWMEAREVVGYSLDSLEKNRCICIPGKLNRFLYKLFKLVPKSLYYYFVKDMDEL